MKKFAKFAGLAALATVGSVFAAWNFTIGQQSINANLTDGVGVQVEQGIVNTGLSGTLTLAHDTNGDNKVTVKQGNDGMFNFKFVDTSVDKITATYTPGTGEPYTDYNYTITLTFTIKHVTTTKTTDLGSTTATYNGNVSGNPAKLVHDFDLSSVTSIPAIPLTNIDSELNSVDNLDEWLRSENANKFTISVSGVVTYANKNS